MEYRIKVSTGEKNERVTKAKDGRLLVFVSAPKKDGRANERARELLAAYLEVSMHDVFITQGQTRSSKIVRVRGS